MFPFATLELDPFVSLIEELSMRKTIIATIALFVAVGIVRAADTTYPDITHENWRKPWRPGQSPSSMPTAPRATKRATSRPRSISSRRRRAWARPSCRQERPGRRLFANEQCSAYRSAAKAASDLGYINVKHYAKGIVGWKASSAKIEAAK